MKKFAITAVAAATMLGAAAAHAYTTGTYSNGFVVPHVYHNTVADTTAIGITNRTGDSVPVYWAFFDVNSNKVLDGCFPMTSNAFKPFIWSEETAGQSNILGQHGYMVFAAGLAGDACDANPDVDSFGESDQDQGLINGAAYQVTTGTMNAETIPTLTGELGFKSGTNLTSWQSDTLQFVEGAFQSRVGEPAATVRFYNPGSTEWVIWSTENQQNNRGNRSYTVQTYNFDQDRTSASFTPENRELNIIDVQTSDAISSWPKSYVEGFSTIDTDDGRNGWGSWFVYARIAQADGANIQTYLGVADPLDGATAP